MTDDPIPWTLAEPEAMVIVRRIKARRHRHRWDHMTSTMADQSRVRSYVPSCACGAIQDPAASRRGKSALRAGKDAERAIAKAYPNARRTGQFGGPDDVVIGELFIVQSKAGSWFSERVWAELAKLPRAGGRIPTLIVSDRPGPGPQRTRRYVVRMMDDDVALHGEKR